MNLETKITIYKFTPQVFTLTQNLIRYNFRSRTICWRYIFLLSIETSLILYELSRTLHL